MSELMRALVYEGPKEMNIREVAIPVPGADEVLIRIERVGICGSELSGFLGHNSLRKPPLIMGHEFSGTIAQIGSGVKGFQLQDRVTANPLVTCGRCTACTTGAAQLCEQRKLLGAHLPGAFAEYVAVPERNVLKLADHVSFEEGAFTEPFACGVRIVRLLDLKPADRLLVVGAGPIGLFALQAAQVHGLSGIIVVDLNEQRLEIARELGATAVRSLEELKESERVFDAAIDGVGMTVTRKLCVESVRPGGRVAFSGLHEADSSLPINTAIRNEVMMYGSFAYAPYDFETALKWISEGRVNLLPWTVNDDLANGGACFTKLLEAPGKIAKIMLEVPLGAR
ncbi:zinc-dependent alcohol dehydrogenase [Paenibacillus eucommiae]|uniref:Threonine dehydrogenase-like Zn-dependent dehydrogenase n=1 Tax=Paenibacillus eucommiae TaxID=1355755 RepID=A0ABS4J8N7_9BACL|nr:galactitol-1-phosphate 5-dehydrogenase [Paenibacillus eucommiae]MBP1995626.1 threonine dehydrogenase-like Zn-dependent dehydrogenase [Paenibacillus eucommiae]